VRKTRERVSLSWVGGNTYKSREKKVRKNLKKEK